jgi:dienelactone hydrolase
MGAKILHIDGYPSLDPVRFLKRQYRQFKPACRFTATTKGRAFEWQRRTRKALAEILGFQNLPGVGLRPDLIEEVDRKDHIRRKVTIQTAPGKRLPVYLLLPKKPAGKTPAVLAFHGHGYGVKDIVGLWENGEERYTADGYHKDFALELVRRGFIVAAPEIMAFGEHVPDLGQGQAPPCHLVGTWAQMLGGTLLGLRVMEARRLLDYLVALPGVDTGRIGAMGISGGGMHAFFSTCLDRRIKACVISGYFCSWFDGILAMHHCICNFVPGILKLGDLPDLAGLLTPRPILVEAGTRDGIFPVEAVRRDVRKLRDIYRLWNAPDRVELDEFEGRHQISGKRAYAFLKENL